MPAQLPRDPWLTRAMRHYALLARHEPRVTDAVTDAQRAFLDEARTAVLNPVTAAAKRRSWWNPLQRMFRWPDRSTWVALLKTYVLPALKRVYREITDARTDEPPEQDWWPAIEVEFVTALERDSWSDQLYDTVRDELEDSRTHDDPLTLVHDRLTRLLSIDAPVRRIRDTFVRRARKGLDYDPTLRPGDYTHRNNARTRARFYTVAACNRAILDAARHEQRATGQQLYTAWMCTHDHRTRPSHLRADKQSVPLGRQFLVGGAKLRYPGDPLGPPEETQNCRCALVPVDKEEHDRLNEEWNTQMTTTDPDATTAAAAEPTMVAWRGMLAPLDTRADYRVIGSPDNGEVRVNQQMWLSHQEEAAPGHEKKRRVGRVDRAWVENGELWGEGVFNPHKDLAQDVARDIANGFDGTVSVDLADATGEERFYDADGYELSTEGHDADSFTTAHPDARKLTYYPSWRLSGATLVQDPAFHTGWVTVLNTGSDAVTASSTEADDDTDPATSDEDDTALSKSSEQTEMNSLEEGETPDGDSPEERQDGEDQGTQQAERGATTASGAPSSWAEEVARLANARAEPDPAVFADPELSGPTKVQVTEDGRVYGHVACWGSSHISFPGNDVTPPASESNYALFHRHPVRCSDGSKVRAGVLVMGTGHADLSKSTSSASAHYDHTGHVVADVRAGEDPHGIWIAGALHPNVTPLQVTILDRYSLSGDWRGGEMVAALVVNTPGFPIPNSLAASAGKDLVLATPSVQCHTDNDGDPYALVAAGMVMPEKEPTTAELATEIRGLRSELAAEREVREQAAAERAEQETRQRLADVAHRVQRPKLDRIARFAATTEGSSTTDEDTAATSTT